MSRSYLDKVDREEIKARLQSIMDDYNISPDTLFSILTKMFKPYSYAAFCMPADKRAYSVLPDEIMKFISSVPDVKSYRACDLRDLVLEKFPNSGIEPIRIYRTCQYYVKKDRWLARSRRWNEEHYERRMELARKSNNKRVALYKESREQLKGGSK